MYKRQVFGDVHWLYFMVDLLACGLFMIGLVQYKEYVSVPYGLSLIHI